MKRSGFISIIVLQMMFIIFIFSMVIFYNSTNLLLISSSSNKGIQSSIISEDKINRLIYDKSYTKEYIYPYLKKECKDDFKSNIYEVKIRDENFKELKGNRINISFTDKNDRKYINIEADIIYKEIPRGVTFYGPIINNIFESQRPYIKFSNLNPEEVTNINMVLDSIEEEMEEYIKNLPSRFTSISTNNKSMTLRYLDDKNIITDFNNKKLNTKHSLLYMTKRKNKNIQLVIGEDTNNVNIINLSGIIFIEGDLIINQNFIFNGIIIVKDGSLIVNKDINPKVKGIIIHKGESEGLEQIDLIYDKNLVYYYGIEIPGFMFPQREVIKKY